MSFLANSLPSQCLTYIQKSKKSEQYFKDQSAWHLLPHLISWLMIYLYIMWWNLTVGSLTEGSFSEVMHWFSGAWSQKYLYPHVFFASRNIALVVRFSYKHQLVLFGSTLNKYINQETFHSTVNHFYVSFVMNSRITFRLIMESFIWESDDIDESPVIFGTLVHVTLSLKRISSPQILLKNKRLMDHIARTRNDFNILFLC